MSTLGKAFLGETLVARNTGLIMNVTENGSYDVTNYRTANVNVSGGQASLQSKSVSPTESEQTVTPDTGYDGLSSVTVNAVSSTYVGSGVTRQAAQTITPGTSDVTIAANQYLTGAQTISGSSNLVAGNIKKDVAIFGVTGTYEGSGGGEKIEPKDVDFYDYDGTLLYSYTALEFANLSAMPDNPTYDNFTAQGWNWTLSDAKTYVAAHGCLVIGQNCVTKDGKTRVYFNIPDDKCLYATSIWTQSASNGVTIDWGDGSATERVSGTGSKQLFHLYSQPGDYILIFTVTSGTVKFGSTTNFRIIAPVVGSGNYSQIFTYGVSKVEVGSGVTEFLAGCFSNFINLEKINIPSTITTATNSCFMNNYNLKCIVIPSGVATIDTSFCNGLYKANAVSIPKSVSAINANTICYCYDLKKLCIPENCKINSTYSFRDNVNVERFVVPTTTTLASNCTNTFYNCKSVKSLPTLLLSGTNKIANGTYSACSSLQSITIPSTVTEIDTGAFTNCWSLRELTIPKNIAAITSAYSYLFNITTLSFPNTVTSVAAGSFSNDANLRTLYIDSTTPPTLANTNAFTSIFPSCAIVVPAESLVNYKSATNWSTYRTNLVGKTTSVPTAVDYISSDGTAYIDIRFPISYIGKIIIEMRYPVASTISSGDGVYNKDSKQVLIGPTKYSNVDKLCVQWGTSTITALQNNDLDWHTIEADFINKRARIDNGSYVSITPAVVRAYDSFWIFKRNGYSTTRASDRRNVKIYDIEGNLVRDMIPVKINNAAYMYDQVNGWVFNNCAASGTLSYTDLSPSFILSGAGTSSDPIVGWHDLAILVNPNQIQDGTVTYTYSGIFTFFENIITEPFQIMYFTDGTNNHTATVQFSPGTVSIMDINGPDRDFFGNTGKAIDGINIDISIQDLITFSLVD